MALTRHHTATVLIVHKNKVLLHKHNRLKILLPVGGHINDNELPEEAAIREAFEETGLQIELYQTDQVTFTDTRCLIRPVHNLLIPISEDHHHIDWVYYAMSESDIIVPQDGESEQIDWFSIQDLESVEMPENIRVMAQEALQILGE